MARIESAVLEAPRTTDQLADIVRDVAAHPESWMSRVRFRVDRRWYERQYCGPDHDVWLITWLPGQGTGFHDHGSSAGVFAVASGVLEEEQPGGATSLVHVGDIRAFGAEYAHDVRNPSAAPAISIHAYSPPLTEMTHYELDGTALVPTVASNEAATEAAADSSARAAGVAAEPEAERGIDALLAAARARLHRLSPVDAQASVTANDALLVDIRPAAQRAIEGEVPGAVVIERNVLEWRLDPASDARLDVANRYDLPVIVICSEGYTSSLAAAALQDVGLWRATDVVGGFHAWQAAGLNTRHLANGAL